MRAMILTAALVLAACEYNTTTIYVTGDATGDGSAALYAACADDGDCASDEVCHPDMAVCLPACTGPERPGSWWLRECPVGYQCGTYGERAPCMPACETAQDCPGTGALSCPSHGYCTVWDTSDGVD